MIKEYLFVCFYIPIGFYQILDTLMIVGVDCLHSGQQLFCHFMQTKYLAQSKQHYADPGIRTCNL